MQLSTHDFPDGLLARYLSGECSEEERRHLEARIAENPALAEQLEVLRKADTVIRMRRPQPDVEAALREHRRRRFDIQRAVADISVTNVASHQSALKVWSAEDAITETEVTHPVLGTRLSSDDRKRSTANGQRQGRRGPVTTIRSLALTLGLGTALAAGAYVAVTARISPSNTGSSVEVLSAKRGERAQFTLGDGTQVTLAPNSRLLLTKSFGIDSRNVVLEGEGVFSVVPNTSMPFIVRALKTETTVLGTRFGVATHPGDSSVRIVVTTGRVSVRQVSLGAQPETTPAPVVINARYAATVSQGAIRIQQHVDADAELEWTKGKLAFTETPFEDVLERLGNWYAVDFQLRDTTLAKRKLNIVFDNQDLSHVLHALRVMLQTNVVRSGTTITILPRTP